MRRAAAVCGCLLVVAGCLPDREPQAGGHGAEPEWMRAEGQRAAVAESLIGVPPVLATVPAVGAQGRTGPGGAPFAVRRRVPSLQQYPCTSCHEGATVRGDRRDDVHQNIRPVHPAENGGTCTTCHLRRDVARLVLLQGETTTLDHAYRLCGQCHFAQAQSWAGGAHGKRVAAWAGPRIVTSCTGCHDPHRPAFQQRIPLRGPTVPRTYGPVP